jgi:hypothetical protein
MDDLMLPSSHPCTVATISCLPHTLTTVFICQLPGCTDFQLPTSNFSCQFSAGSQVELTRMSKSKSCYDQRSVGQSVLVSRPIWGTRPHYFCYFQTVTVLSMWGALFDKGMGLSFIVVVANSTCLLHLQFYMMAFYMVSQLSRVWFHVDTYYLQFYM